MSTNAPTPYSNGGIPLPQVADVAADERYTCVVRAVAGEKSISKVADVFCKCRLSKTLSVLVWVELIYKGYSLIESSWDVKDR